MNYATGSRKADTLDDLRAAAASLSLENATDIEVWVSCPTSISYLDARIMSFYGFDDPTTLLVVEGAKEAAVAGVASRRKERIDAAVARIERAETAET